MKYIAKAYFKDKELAPYRRVSNLPAGIFCAAIGWDGQDMADWDSRYCDEFHAYQSVLDGFVKKGASRVEVGDALAKMDKIRRAVNQNAGNLLPDHKQLAALKGIDSVVTVLYLALQRWPSEDEITRNV